MKKFVCLVCGYVHTGDEPPASCPICGAGADQFKEMPAEAPAAAGRDAFAAAHIGRIAEVLVETREESGAALGYTRDYLPVRVLAVGDALPDPGAIVRVRMHRRMWDMLQGSLAGEGASM